MNETRKQILDRLRYLRKNWEEVNSSLYPGAIPGVLKYERFLLDVKRDKYIQRSVLCSNGQDPLCISVGEIDKETLLTFIQSLPEDSFINVDHHQDYDDYSEYIMQAWYYRKETDKEYLERLNSIYEAVKLINDKKRCNDPDVNRYIEHLEKRLTNKEG